MTRTVTVNSTKMHETQTEIRAWVRLTYLTRSAVHLPRKVSCGVWTSNLPLSAFKQPPLSPPPLLCFHYGLNWREMKVKVTGRLIQVNGWWWPTAIDLCSWKWLSLTTHEKHLKNLQHVCLDLPVHFRVNVDVFLHRVKLFFFMTKQKKREIESSRKKQTL